MPTRFMIYGENWEGTLPNLLAEELRRRGFFVSSFDFTHTLPGIRNRAFTERLKRRLFETYFTKRIRSRFLSEIETVRPEILVVVKGSHLDKETIQKIRKQQIYVINWNPDDFFNPKTSSDALLGAFSEYDLIVSSRPHLFPEYKDRGAKKLLYLDWYYVPELHLPQNSETLEIKHEATFVGSWSPSREAFISKLNTPFKIWGGGWEKSALSFKRRHGVCQSVLNQREMAQVFATSRYNLNLLTRENRDQSNLRFFEVTAAGGLLLTERNPLSESRLVDRKECLMFSSSEEVNEMLATSTGLSEIAKAGAQRTRASQNAFANRIDGLIAGIQAESVMCSV